MVQVARKRSVHALDPLQVTTLLIIISLLLAQDAAAEELNMLTNLRGHTNHDSEALGYFATPTLDQVKSHADGDWSEDPDAMDQPHPADELLKFQGADGSQSYILGGY